MANEDRINKPSAGRIKPEAADAIRKGVTEGVGYKSPPRQSRFKPGHSGNPNGRPRREQATIAQSLPIHDLVLQTAQKLIQIREGDQTRNITLIEAVLQSQAKTALGGSAYAQKHVIERFDKAQAAHARKIAGQVALWSDYVAKARSQIDQAREAGRPEPKILPHPDDIVIDPIAGVRIKGPFDEQSEAQVLEACRFRDHLLLQDVLDQRLIKPVFDNPDDQPGSAFLLAIQLNETLPQRFRKDDVAFVMAIGRAERLPQRALLKAVREGWRALGKPKPRGATLPPVGVMKQKLTIAFAWLAAHKRGDIDPNMSTEDIAGHLLDIAEDLGFPDVV